MSFNSVPDFTVILLIVACFQLTTACDYYQGVCFEGTYIFCDKGK